MKRYIAILLLVMIALGLSGCREEVSTPDTYVPSVMYDGDIYCTTGKQVPGEVAEDAIIGRITSTVSLTQWPEEDGQANFDGLDSPYAMTSDGFVVLFNNEWTLFELREEME
jgi:hypothetical protein